MSTKAMSTCTVGLLTLVASAAHATVVTFEYTGYVDIVDDPHDYLDGSVQLGTLFYASYSFDTDSPPGYVHPLGTSYYDALRSYNLTIGSYTVSGVGVYDRILVRDSEDGWDQFLVVNDPRPFAGQWVTISQDLSGGNDAAMASPDLPSVPPRLEDFDACEFALYTSSGSLGIRGVITSLTPEPSTFLFLGSGVWVVARRVKRRA